MRTPHPTDGPACRAPPATTRQRWNLYGSTGKTGGVRGSLSSNVGGVITISSFSSSSSEQTRSGTMLRLRPLQAAAIRAH